jgi:hypothetical protein
MPSPKWLLFVHQLPSNGSNLRVRTWRRLQNMGAVPLRQSVYILPAGEAAREDFAWLSAEIQDAGGDASVFAADCVDTWSDDKIVETFRRASLEAYDGLAREVERAIAKMKPRAGRAGGASGRLLAAFRQRFEALARVDFFAASGRDRLTGLLATLETKLAKPNSTSRSDGPSLDRHGYSGRTWATRPRPGIDRMSSAWLIRRFIDPTARFAFVPDRTGIKGDAIGFDMPGVDFTHHGNHCTFETLAERFDITDRAVGHIARVVHDLDLKEARFNAPETATIGALVEGLRLAHDDDGVLLERGIAMFEALYRAVQIDVQPPHRSSPAGRRAKKAAR